MRRKKAEAVYYFGFECPGLDYFMIPILPRGAYSKPSRHFVSLVFLICPLLKESFQRFQIKKPSPAIAMKALCPGLDSNQHNLSDAAT
jgi:hypothetical protein